MPDALTVASGMGKLNAVDFSFDLGKRYTIWSGVIAATFHMLAYFGTDQSQVQRYISGASARESRLGLMFNAALKIPMQFSILAFGVMLFVFYQFEKPPVYFDQVAWHESAATGQAGKLNALDQNFSAAFENQREQLRAWVSARHAHDAAAESATACGRRRSA